MDNVYNRPHRVYLPDGHEKPEGVQSCIAISPINYVGIMEDGRTVLKYPAFRKEEYMESLYEEAARYEVLGLHDNLVNFKGIHENGLLFEYCERGSLEDVILRPPALTDVEKREIGKQITRCLIFLHGKNFIHCDLHVRNVFMTSALVAKVGDIQGQLYNADGTVNIPTMSEENPKSRHPFAGEDEFTPQTDLFALGTLLYHLWHGHDPFPELNEYLEPEAVKARYRAGIFPVDAKQASGMDRIVSKCWHSEYKEAVEVLADMDDLDV